MFNISPDIFLSTRSDLNDKQGFLPSCFCILEEKTFPLYDGEQRRGSKARTHVLPTGAWLEGLLGFFADLLEFESI